MIRFSFEQIKVEFNFDHVIARLWPSITMEQIKVEQLLKHVGHGVINELLVFEGLARITIKFDGVIILDLIYSIILHC